MIRKVLELIGVVTLMLTILGVVTAIDWVTMTRSTFTVSSLGIILIIVSLCGSMMRLIGNEKVVKKFMYVMSTILAFFSMIIFSFVPHFFTETLSFPSHFWAIVSLYSIPAICAEGSLFNFFFYFPPWNDDEKELEIPAWYGYAFIIYATIAILVCFMAIYAVITPYTHIIFTRLILLIALCGYVYIYRKIRS